MMSVFMLAGNGLRLGEVRMKKPQAFQNRRKTME
jgi:hypothetical protein